ncbi:peptide deformylase [Candidatus Roizmanbacteria bacterium]|nr:peptide deformylase [Candidatus Roizmanbacteria bacterium]
MTKRRGDLLQIAQLGHTVLRKKAKTVKDVKGLTVQKLIDDLISTVMDVDGVGIGAPQVYKSLRIFILASHPNPRYPKAPKMKPSAVINPKIISYSKEKKKDWEGCLSIPGIRGLIPRHHSINVEFTNRDGTRLKKTYKDFVARIFQHEFDHLEGIMFVDRVESSKDLISEKEYQKLMKKDSIIKAVERS